MIDTILYEAGMRSTRPSSYTGNGAVLTDLNVMMLDKIADAIKQKYGNFAHDQFVKMVWDMKILSAYAFQNNLYALYKNNFHLFKVKISNKDYSGGELGDYYVGYDSETIKKIEDPNKLDQTEEIRKGFRKVLS